MARGHSTNALGLLNFFYQKGLDDEKRELAAQDKTSANNANDFAYRYGMADPQTRQLMLDKAPDLIGDPSLVPKAIEAGQTMARKRDLDTFAADPFVQGMLMTRSNGSLPNRAETQSELLEYASQEYPGVRPDVFGEFVKQNEGYFDDPMAYKMTDSGASTIVQKPTGLDRIDDTPTPQQDTYQLKEGDGGEWFYFNMSNPQASPIPTGQFKKDDARKMSITLPDGTVISEGGADIPTGVKSAWMKDYVEAQQRLDTINTIELAYKPEYLTYTGKAKGRVDDLLNRMNPDARSEFRRNQTKFISLADREFLSFRKWATGVAGGEKEMNEIKAVTFSSDDSPQDFEAKLEAARDMYVKLNVRLKAALSQGINNEKAFKEFAKEMPLDEIPSLQERGDQLFSSGEYTQEQVLQKLREEGYEVGNAR